MGDIVLTIDADTLAVKSVTINGKVPRVDNLKTHPMKVSAYDTMVAFESWAFMVFKDAAGNVVARYAKRPNCDYYWV